MAFIYTGSGKIQPKDAPACQRMCIRESRAIQYCLAKNGSNEEPDVGGKRSHNDVDDSSDSDGEAPIGGKKKRTEAAPSDDEGSSDEFQYKYGEDLLGDEDDRANVAGLNEMDRELIMSERYEEREDAKERWNLVQKKKEKERRAKEDAASAGAAKITRGRRSGKSEDAKKQKLEDLKARRKKTKRAKEEKEAAYEEEVEEEEGDYSEVDDEDSADDWGGGAGGRKKKKKKGGRGSRRDSFVGDDDDEDDFDASDSDSGGGRGYGVAASMEEVQKIRLSRHRMEQWVHEPFFSDIVIGCFVRIGIGNGKDGNQVYKCAEIVDVSEEGQVYTLGKTRTKKRIKLKHGLEAKYFKMASISNQDFTPQEFSRWKGDMDDNDLQVTDDKFVARKVSELATAKTKEHTNLDVQKILAEKRKVGITKGNSGARRKQLELEIDAFERQRLDAEADEDELRANEYDAKIQEKMTEKEELMRVAEIRRQRRFGAGTALNVAKINQRNIGSNFGVRKGKGKLATEAATEAAAAAAAAAPGLGPRRNSTQVLNSTHTELDLDLDIDIDLPDDFSESAKPAAAKVPAKAGGGRRGLNLSAFKQARGFI